MRLRNSSLATRVTIGILVMVIAGTATLLFVENTHHRNAHVSERRAHLEKELQTGNLRLNQAINTLRQDVLFLSNAPPVPGIVRAALNRGYDPRYGNTHQVWAERLQQIFSAFSVAHPDYYQIRYIGVANGGRELVRIDHRSGKIEITSPDRLQAKGDRDYFKAAVGLRAGEVFISKFDSGEGNEVVERPHRPTLRAATPVFTPSGELFGMVVINLDAGNLLKSAVSDLPGVQTYITNSDGQYLLRADSQQAFKSGTGSTNKITVDFPFINTIFDPQAPDYFPLQAAATKTGGPLFAAQRISFEPGDSSRFLILMHYLPGTVVTDQVVKIPVDTLFYEFVVMLLVGGIATLILRRTFSPLKQITVAADKITAGDHDIRLPQTDGGEIGSLTGALNTMLTKLSQREKALLESEAKYRLLYQSMMDAFVMTDMSGRILESNQTYQDMLGYSADELQRLAYIDLTPEKWHQFEERIVAEQIIPLGYSQVYEKEYIRKNGTVFPVELKAILIRGKDNQAKAMWAIVRDITERKRIENELSRFFTLVPDLVCIASADGSFLKINAAWQQALGYTVQEILATPFLELIHPDDREATITEVERQLAGEATVQFTNRYRCKDGSYRWLEWRASPAVDQKLLFASARDITERKQAGELLRKSAEEIEDLYNRAPCGYHSLDKDGIILRINDTELAWLGYTRDELIGIKWPNLLAPQGLRVFRETFTQFMRQGFVRDIEAEITRKDGTIFTGLVNATAIYDSGGNFVMSRSTIVDITERQRAKFQLQDLTAHLQTVREEEKTTIARELHDDLGGTLAAMKIETYWLKADLSAGKETNRVVERIDELSRLINNAAGDMRRIITGLHPSILDDLGLLAAIEWQAGQFHKRTGIICQVNCIEDKGDLDKTRSIAVFRILQEALTNVVRHSGASSVEIEFQHSDEELIMSIIDNGRGMLKERADASIPYGILGMRERVDQLGGQINFDTPYGGGFAITVRLPLPANKKEKT